MSTSEDATISEPKNAEYEMFNRLSSSGDLFLLPEEVQEVVLDHLEVKDLVSCCKVCRLWRAGINVSHIWKKWCKVESYNPQLMEKHWNERTEDDRFSNMGWWRKVYCWHAVLEMNWRRKLCLKFKLMDTDSCVYCFDIDTDGDLAATGHENGSVVVWSMKIPPTVIGRVQGVLNSSPISSVRVQGDLLVVIQRRLIQVFHKAGDKFELTDLKSFEMGEANVDQMENYVKQKTEYSSWYLECLRSHDRMALTTPGGIIYNVHGSTLYVSVHHSKTVWSWTLPRSEVQFSVQVQAEVCQILKDQDAVYFVARDHITNFMKYEVGSETPNVLLSVPGLKHMMIGDELVLALPAPGDVTLKRVWAYKKGDYSQPIGTRTLSGFSVVAITHPDLVIYSEGSAVTVWDPVRNANCAHFTLNEPVSYLKPTFASFLLIFSSRSLCLWDWKKGKMLYRIYNGLEWTGNYANLLWANATTMLSGGVAYQLEMISFGSSASQLQPILKNEEREPSEHDPCDFGSSSATLIG